jgi:hypothetical protein
MKYVALPLAALSLFGCVATGPLYKDAPPPPEGKALVYIYREQGVALVGRQTWFYVDDVEVGELDNQGYTWAYVPAGLHTLKQEWPLDITLGRTTDTTIDLQAGQSYYYKLRTAASFGYNTVSAAWEIANISPRIGNFEISQYHYQPAKHPDIAAAADKTASQGRQTAIVGSVPAYVPDR